MANIDKHIVSLLQERDCVIIPGFGGLISQYVPVRIHPVRHSMTPPSKKLAFNQKLQVNDGALESFVAIQEHLSGADAATRVALFVQSVNMALNQHQQYAMQDIGLFRKENDNSIAFECEEKVNLLAESFGLPEVFSKPVQRHRGLAEIRAAVQEKVAERQPLTDANPRQIPLWRKALRYAAVIPIIMLTASAIYLATLDRGFTLSSLNPVSYLLPAIPNWYPVNKIPVTVSESNPKSTFNAVEPTDEQRLEFYKAIVPHALIAVDEPEFGTTHAYLNDEFLSQQVPETETPAAEISWDDSPAPDAGLDNFNNTIISEPNANAGTEIAANKPAPETAASKAQSTRYYVIGGGFAEPANARDLHQRAVKNGLDAKILEPGKGSRLHRVSLADFDSPAEAWQQLAELKSTYGKTLWVLEY